MANDQAAHIDDSCICALGVAMAVTGAEVHGDFPRPVSCCKHGDQPTGRKPASSAPYNPVITIHYNLEPLHFVSKKIRLFFPDIHTEDQREI
jgi:hypothetical protein